MKIEKYICDRCRKPILEPEGRQNFPYCLVRINKYPFGYYIRDKEIDLCENCRNSFKKWLGEEDT